MIPMNDWHCTVQQFFMILSKDKLKRFSENNVGIYFCQDFEMYPNFNFFFFAYYIGWLQTVKHVHAYGNIPIYFAMASDISPFQKKQLLDNFGDQVNFVTSPLLLIFCREELARKNPGLDITKIYDEYMNTAKQKQFMSLTRDSKYHRLTMIHGLRSHDVLDQGYVSNLMPRKYSAQYIKSKSQYAERVIQDMANLLPKMEVDPVVGLEPSIANGIGGDIPFAHMAASCYDLVQETATKYENDMVLDMHMITEKTLKSLLLGRPFMINGGQGTLKLLKRWGFKTYDNVFDESYDNLPDFIDRQEIIVSNVMRYRNRYSRLLETIKSGADRIEHNIQNVIQFDFEKHLINEILNPGVLA